MAGPIDVRKFRTSQPLRVVSTGATVYFRERLDARTILVAETRGPISWWDTAGVVPSVDVEPVE